MAGPFATLLDWIDIPSVSGDEGDYADAVARTFEAAGLSVERQEVEPGRFNLLARAGEPEAVFCTHLDTVPPWFGPSEDREHVHGRGACDAKGVALCMLEAARRLLAAGEDRIGFLLTVGEEVDFAGARVANARLTDPWRPRWIVVGEPTDNRFIRGHKGIYKARLVAHGVAGHSSEPIGPSAVHELVRCAHGLLETDWGRHALFGEGMLNLGQIAGGVAPNVVADRAEAEIVVRAVDGVDDVEARIRPHLGERVELVVDKGFAPQEFHVPEGEDADVVGFGTDAPSLDRWGTPLLFGPGSIRDAHTDHERISKRSFEEGVERYVRTVGDLLRAPR